MVLDELHSVEMPFVQCEMTPRLPPRSSPCGSGLKIWVRRDCSVRHQHVRRARFEYEYLQVGAGEEVIRRHPERVASWRSNPIVGTVPIMLVTVAAVRSKVEHVEQIADGGHVPRDVWIVVARLRIRQVVAAA